MTEERLVLADLLEKAGDGDFLRAVAEAVLQLLIRSASVNTSGYFSGSTSPLVTDNTTTLCASPRST